LGTYASFTFFAPACAWAGLKVERITTQFLTKSFSQLSTIELFKIYKLRSEVFIVEQNCAYQDVDEKDLKAFHILMIEEEELVGYCRAIPPGISYDEASIGRVTVVKTHRHHGIGKQLMEYSVQKTLDLFAAKEIVISAQSYLKKFYTDLGFEAEGQDYLEDDIPHIKMRLSVK
jgi:predicted GNAT family N-acyltransferase